jgi:hypothetical protein
MYVYTYMNMYINIYMHMYILIYTYLFIYTYIRFLFLYEFKYMYEYFCTYIYKPIMRTGLYPSSNTSPTNKHHDPLLPSILRKFIQLFILYEYVLINIHIYIYIYLYICIYIFIGLYPSSNTSPTKQTSRSTASIDSGKKYPIIKFT